MNTRNHSRSLVVSCPSLRCSGISGTLPKSKPCSLCQSLYTLQSYTMLSVIVDTPIASVPFVTNALPLGGVRVTRSTEQCCGRFRIIFLKGPTMASFGGAGERASNLALLVADGNVNRHAVANTLRNVISHE